MRSGPAPIAGLLLGLALILPGCGGDQAATAEGAGDRADAAASAARPSGSPHASPPQSPPPCGRRLSDLVDSLESLSNSLAVGLDYGDYLSAVNHARASYAKVPAERLQLACLTRVATPAERSLDDYIEAANAWGDCLATAGCRPGSIEGKLQSMWRRASTRLDAL